MPLQETARLARQEPPGLLFYFPVGVAEANLHPIFLAPRQNIIKPEHVDIDNKEDETRPGNQQPETSDSEKKVLRMADSFVETARHHTTPRKTLHGRLESPLLESRLSQVGKSNYQR